MGKNPGDCYAYWEGLASWELALLVTWEKPDWDALLSSWEIALSARGYCLPGNCLPESCCLGKHVGPSAWLSTWLPGVCLPGRPCSLPGKECCLPGRPHSLPERVLSAGEAWLPAAWGEALGVTCLPACEFSATWGEASMAWVACLVEGNCLPACELIVGLVAGVACMFAAWGEAPAAGIAWLLVGELCQVIFPSFFFSKLLNFLPVCPWLFKPKFLYFFYE